MPSNEGSLCGAALVDMPPPCPLTGVGERPLLNGEQVHDEDEGLPRLDGTTRAARSVPEFRRDRQPPPATDLHPGDALVPAADDLTGAEPEGEGFAAVPRCVELPPCRPAVADVLH